MTFTAGLLLTLALLTYLRRPPTAPKTGKEHRLIDPQEITVTVDGAVTQPGVYTLPKKAKIDDLLTLARPLSNAKVEGLKKTLKDGQHLHIEEQKFITVWVEGEVTHPRFYTLPEGATMGHLLRKLELTDLAVTYKLKRRETLKDHQIVAIPRRQRARSKAPA